MEQRGKLSHGAILTEASADAVGSPGLNGVGLRKNEMRGISNGED